VLPERWVTCRDSVQNTDSLQQQGSARHAGDRYAQHGEDIIQEAALAAIEKLRSLPAGQAETFAQSFKKGTDKLTVAQDKLTASLERLPATLLVPLVKPNVRQFPTIRKQAMAGREAAEEQERDKRRQQQRAAVQAQAQHEENSFYQAEMVADIRLQQSQSQSRARASLLS
jgi:hypothetical protein